MHSNFLVFVNRTVYDEIVLARLGVDELPSSETAKFVQDEMRGSFVYWASELSYEKDR